MLKQQQQNKNVNKNDKQNKVFAQIIEKLRKNNQTKQNNKLQQRHLLSFEQWCILPAREGPTAGKLAKGQFQEKQGNPDKRQHDDVGDEEGAAAVTVAEVGESPDIPEPHSVTQARQQEVQLPRPVPAFLVLVFTERLFSIVKVGVRFRGYGDWFLNELNLMIFHSFLWLNNNEINFLDIMLNV